MDLYTGSTYTRVNTVGTPRIGIFAERQRPEPIHCEINAWQHVLNNIYRVAAQRGVFTKFIDILSASAVERRADQGNGNGNRKSQVYVPHNDGAGERSTRVDFVNASNQKFVCDLGNALSSNHKEDFGELGCGLGYLASVIKDHYNDEAQRHKKLPVWLIGGQPIALITFLFCSLMPLKS